MNSKYPLFSYLVASASHFSFRFIFKLYGFANAFLSGFWLGIMGEKSLDAVDEISYSQKNLYTNEDYNMSGLFNWEKEMIDKHFRHARNLLLIAVGGGREVFALIKLGFKVEGYECNPKLVEFGNALLEKLEMPDRIKLLPRDHVPPGSGEYDGIIVGWGAYSHIRGREKRKQFINKLLPLLKWKAPLMISFVTRKVDTTHDKIIIYVSSFFRFLRGISRTEHGDRLNYNYFHYFRKDEIFSELQACQFRVLDFYDKEYGCAVAEKIMSDTL
ncbi:MAG: hypothetical protein FJY81_00015 [Candidatus Aminicenantes bacterium]|nr:hypothetical protein [Candidatus Aminicenantes bacterium]